MLMKLLDQRIALGGVFGNDAKTISDPYQGYCELIEYAYLMYYG